MEGRRKRKGKGEVKRMMKETKEKEEKQILITKIHNITHPSEENCV